MNLKNKILKALGKKWFSTSKIASIVANNYYNVLKAVKELETEGKIETLKTPGGIYWRAKNEKV